METYKVIVEIAVGKDQVQVDDQIPMTKSHQNSLMRRWVWLSVASALTEQGLTPHTIKSVVKVQKKEGNR